MKTALSIALAVTLVSPSLGLAQEGPAQFINVATLTAAPGMTAQFENVVRQVHEAYKTTGKEPQVVFAYSTVMGGSGSTYYLVTPFRAWGDVDDW